MTVWSTNTQSEPATARSLATTACLKGDAFVDVDVCTSAVAYRVVLCPDSTQIELTLVTRWSIAWPDTHVSSGTGAGLRCYQRLTPGSDGIADLQWKGREESVSDADPDGWVDGFPGL